MLHRGVLLGPGAVGEVNKTRFGESMILIDGPHGFTYILRNTAFDLVKLHCHGTC